MIIRNKQTGETKEISDTEATKYGISSNYNKENNQSGGLLDLLPYLTAGGAGLIGTALGPAGTVAGAALGYGGGYALKDLIQGQGNKKTPYSPWEAPGPTTGNVPGMLTGMGEAGMTAYAPWLVYEGLFPNSYRNYLINNVADNPNIATQDLQTTLNQNQGKYITEESKTAGQKNLNDLYAKLGMGQGNTTQATTMTPQGPMWNKDYLSELMKGNIANPQTTLTAPTETTTPQVSNINGSKLYDIIKQFEKETGAYGGNPDASAQTAKDISVGTRSLINQKIPEIQGVNKYMSTGYKMAPIIKKYVPYAAGSLGLAEIVRVLMGK